MLQPILEGLHGLRIILASGSPRRKEILKNVGADFEIIPSDFEENLDKSRFDHPSDYVKENSKEKAIQVFNSVKSKDGAPDLVIGADTVVVHGGSILEKPKDREDAFRMLKGLSGTSHEVYSGMSFIWPGKQSPGFAFCQFHVCTEVEFGTLSDDVIAEYIQTEEPLDKAGAYGIQGKGGTLVKGIRGDYFNVVGLPLFSFCKELREWYSMYKDSSLD